MLKSSLLVVAVVSLVTAAVLTRSQTPSTSTPAPAPALTQPQTVTPQPATAVKNPVKPTAESQAKAKALYAIDCAMCHSDNGSGKSDLAKSMSLTLDDWTSPGTLAGKQDWELFNIIRNGKGDKMPAEGEGRAKDTEVWNLIIYIRSFSKGAAASAVPAAPADATATAK